MNDTTAGDFELAVRTGWSLNLVGGVVNVARKAGWAAAGEPLEVEDAGALLRKHAKAIEGRVTPMRMLAAACGLGEVEVDILWLLACIELDPGVARVAQLLTTANLGTISAQVLEVCVTVGKPGVHATKALERLAGLALVEYASDARVSMQRRPVRIADRVLDLVRGSFELDREIADVAALADTRTAAGGGDEPVPTVISQAVAGEQHVLVVVRGAKGSGRTTLLKQALGTAGRPALVVSVEALATDATALARQLRVTARECRLYGATPIFVGLEGLRDRWRVLERELLQSWSGPVLATAEEACDWTVSCPVVTHRLETPTIERSERLWSGALAGALPEVARTCAARYTLVPGAIAQAATTAIQAAGSADEVTVAHVHAAIGEHVQRRISGLADRIETKQRWQDRVLPADEFDRILELLSRVQYRDGVMNTWGFGAKVGDAGGVAALFSGPPGTGKTMLAGLIANELGLDLYRVDLSKIMSKYIGETEKQLGALFDAAETGHAILLFDEADSIFGKRTDVKSSNDRYSNLSVNYLLQRMETFSGITLLTTNHESAIDPAFMRRLSMHVRVPMPDGQQRLALWEALIPATAEMAPDVSFAALASKFVMSGGHIKNAVVRAAFLAANDQSRIETAHLWQAAHLEYEAMGKLAVHDRETLRAA